MGVVLVLVLIWAAVFVPPLVRAHAARQDAFLVSLGATPDPGMPDPAAVRSLAVQRRRHIAGGLLVAMGATLAAGLLPALRSLLVVHLFVVDSFIAYIAFLAYVAGGRPRLRWPRSSG